VAFLPQLEALYQKWQQAGLEIVGINFDAKRETAQKRTKSLGLTFPQVWVADDDNTRLLWREASGIGSMPRLFFIDSEGLLRAERQSHEGLEAMVSEMLKKKTGSNKR
jgi:hypothetical protein